MKNKDQIVSKRFNNDIYKLNYFGNYVVCGLSNGDIIIKDIRNMNNNIINIKAHGINNKSQSCITDIHIQDNYIWTTGIDRTLKIIDQKHFIIKNTINFECGYPKSISNTIKNETYIATFDGNIFVI